MKTRDIEKFKEKLEAFMADLVLQMGRSERRRYAEIYVRGLLMDLDRKSIEPIANLVVGADVQALQQFINQSPWSHNAIRASLARKLEDELIPSAYWIVDEVSFPKKGKHSAGVAYQYCGALGKTANCQVAVTLDLGTEEASVPLNWALYLPEQWINDSGRRKKARIPEGTVFKSKIELAMELIDQALEWGLEGQLVLADSLYGDSFAFRQELSSRQIDYIVQVEGKLTGWNRDPHPVTVPLKKKGGGARKRLYAKELPETQTFSQMAKTLPAESWKTIIWREGTKGPLCSRFARIMVWAANGLIQGKTLKVAPEQLLIEWPEEAEEPVKFWLSSLNLSVPFRTMVRRAKGRFRIEQDYQEMKTELGLDHFEGRSWQGWHHHVTLVAIAYAFLTLEKLHTKKNFWVDLASCPPVDPKMASSV
jgi:SRSO17 transposase